MPKKRSKASVKALPEVICQSEFALAGMSSEPWSVSAPTGVSFRTLGLDNSLTGTGIIVLDQDGNIVWQETIGFGLEKDAPTREVLERIIYITNRVLYVVRKYDVEYVAVEGYAYGKTFRREQLAELGGVVKTQLFLSTGIVPVIVAPSTARAVVFGKGCGGIKKAFVRPLLKNKGVSIKDPDQADAYVIARYLRWRVLTDGKRN